MTFWNKILFVLFFSCSFFFFELLVRLAIDNSAIKIFSSGLFFTVLFSLSFGFLLVGLTNLFPEKINFPINLTVVIFFSFLYASQLIYFEFFRTFYSVYSARNWIQILEFWSTIQRVAFANILWIVLLFLPFLFLIFIRKKIFSFEKSLISLTGIFIITSFLLHGIGLIILASGDKHRNSAYDLYYHNVSPVLSIDRLGLFTTMRIDLQRHLTVWSPVLSEDPVQPDTNNPNLALPTDDSETDQLDDNDHVKEREKNLLAIDFDKLLEHETEENIQQMHSYFKQASATDKNDYTGKFAGYNLVFITAEAFAPYAAHPVLTPTLYKMVHEGIQFTDFYVPLWDVSTSDGEYVALNGLLPKSGVWSFYHSGTNHMPFVMGNQLKKSGYKTLAYHNHTYDYYRRDVSHPNMGYDYKAVGNGLDIKPTWPASDLEMFEVTIPEYINEEPFHAYYMTVSGHLQYSFSGNSIAYKNKHYLEDFTFSEQAKAYLATQIELDKALAHLLKELEKSGAAANTLIVMSTDHYPYGLDFETIEEFIGGPVDRNFDIYKSNLIMYTPNMEEIIVDKPMSSLDIIPTLSNLLGLDYDSRLLMGRDVFSDAKPLVIFRNGSFITEKGRFNTETNFFQSNHGDEPDPGYIELIQRQVDEKFYYSTKILDLDYYRILFE